MLQEEQQQLVEKLHYLDALNLLKDSYGVELLKLWKQKLSRLVKIYLELSEYCENLGAPKPRTFVRKGILHEELFNLIDKEKAIRVLVLGVSTEHGNPGPLINYVINKGSTECRVPITIVPEILQMNKLMHLFKIKLLLNKLTLYVY